MMDMIILRANEGFHKENFNRFVKEVAAQAETTRSEHKSISSAEQQLESPTRNVSLTMGTHTEKINHELGRH